MADGTCAACGGAIYTYNYDMARGVVGLTRAWKHYSLLSNLTHSAIPRGRR